jgi:hypothetical protein
MTDWTVDRELHPVFIRVNALTDLQGADTPEEIDRRLDRTVEVYDLLLKRGVVSRKKAEEVERQVNKLQDANFSTYVIASARRHPSGLIALSLKYGHDRAVDLVLERNLRLRRMTRVRASGRALRRPHWRTG